MSLAGRSRSGPAWHPGPALSGPCCVLAVDFCGLLLMGLVQAILDPACVHPVACLVLMPSPVPRLRLGPCAVTLPARFSVRLGRSVPKFAALICGLKRPTHDAPLAGLGKALRINSLLETGWFW
jgi:hypothetical protein